MHAGLLRGIKRTFFHIARISLMPLEAAYPRRYMRIYAALLRRYGVDFTGTPRYISSSVRFDAFNLVTLGERAVLSRNVILLTHDYSLTTALIAIGEPPPTDVSVNRNIRIGSNVFVGMNAILLPGTMIEDNVIVAAGSVVRGHVEGDSIVAGNPAQKVGVIRKRAEEWRNRYASQGIEIDSW